MLTTPTVAIALTRAPLAAFGSRPKLRRALGQLLHAPAQPPTAAEAAAAVAVADGAADDEPAPGQPLLFLLPPPEHEAAVPAPRLPRRVRSPPRPPPLVAAAPLAKPLSEARAAPRRLPHLGAHHRLAPPRRVQPRPTEAPLVLLSSTRSTSLIYDDLVRLSETGPAATTTRHAAAPTAGTPDSARCVQSGESGAPTLAAALPTTLLFSLSLSRSLFSPALKSQTTGAPPPSPLPAAAPSPALPGWQIAWRSPEPLGPCLTNPAHTTRASGRSGQTTVGLEYSTGPLPHWRNRSTIRQTTSLPPPGTHYARSRSTRRPLEALRSPPFRRPLSRRRVLRSDRDSKFKNKGETMRASPLYLTRE